MSDTTSDPAADPPTVAERARRPRAQPRRIVSRYQRPEHRSIVASAGEAINRGRDVLGLTESPADLPVTLDGLEQAVVELIELAITEVGAPGARRARIAAVAELAIDLETTRSLIRERRVAERLQVLVTVGECLDRLRAIDDVDELLARTPEAICRATGLERGVLSRVDGSEWSIEGAYFDGDEEWTREFVRLGRNEGRAQLNHMILETEMIRRRAPSMIIDALNHPLSHRALVEQADVRSYVAAPIMPENRVIGFIHADHYYSAREVDTLDRDTIWAFAQGFGHVFERASLFGRLRAQRGEVKRLLASVDVVMEELTGAELQFHRSDTGAFDVAQSAAALFVAPESRLEMLLTARQFEILGLMAAGATNSDIANRLVIAEGTVKTHVKHILRKLRAANRAEAVSRYFRLSLQQGAPGLHHED